MSASSPKPSPDVRRALYDELLRRSLGHFHSEAFSILHGGEQIEPGPYIEAMVHVLEQVARGDIKRLIITLPPRHGKSELVSGSFGAWLMGNDPTVKVTVASYGMDLARPLVDKARTIMRDPKYRQLFPQTQIQQGKDKAELFATTNGGEFRAATRAGAMTGLGTHFLIVDDFQKAAEALSLVERESAILTFKSTFFSRFDNLADGRIIIVQQRLHEDDLVGWALRHGNWHHLNLPAVAEEDQTIPLPRGKIWCRKKGDLLAPKRVPLSYLEEQKLIMGSRLYNAQYQQNPAVAEGSLIDMQWFGQYDEAPQRSFFHKIVQSWDPAITERITSDYSVGMTWGFRDAEWYLLDLIRIQAGFNNVLERTIAWHRQWKADALIIEGASIGHALYEQVQKAKLPGIIRCPTPRFSKQDRLAGRTAQLATGDYLLPASAPWLPALRHELLAFPDGRNDDQVDAMVQFLEFVFSSSQWIERQYDSTGRPMRPSRPERRPRYYDGEAPSRGSW